MKSSILAILCVTLVSSCGNNGASQTLTKLQGEPRRYVVGYYLGQEYDDLLRTLSERWKEHTGRANDIFEFERYGGESGGGVQREAHFDLTIGSLYSLNATMMANKEADPLFGDFLKEAQDLIGKESFPFYTRNGDIYGRPLFGFVQDILYYDKTAFMETDVVSWETLSASASAKNLTFAGNLASFTQYYGFFAGTGATTSFVYNEDNTIHSIINTIDPDKGLLGAKALFTAAHSPSYISAYSFVKLNEDTKAFMSSSGFFEEAKRQYGENLGFASLPSFSVNGREFPQFSYADICGASVSNHIDSDKADCLNDFVSFLLSSDSQAYLAQSVPGLSPVVHEDVELNPMQQALSKGLTHATLVDVGAGGYQWFSECLEKLVGDILSSDGSDQSLRTALTDYSNSLSSLVGK